jgi:type I restriction enzyme, S subunit
LSELVELPNGWVETKLGDIVSSVKGKKPKNLGIKNKENKIPYITIKSFEKKIFEQYTGDNSCPMCMEKDLLIVWDGSRSGLIGYGVSGIIGSTLAKIQCYDNDSNFIRYFLQSKYEILNTNVRGIGIPHINPTILWNLKFLLPPLNEQKQIVSKIKELFLELDNVKDTLQKVKLQLVQYRQQFLSFSLEERNTNNSTKLETKYLKELIVKIIDHRGITPKKLGGDWSKKGIPVLSAKNIKNYKISRRDQIRFIPNEMAKRWMPENIERGDILMTSEGATLGELALLREETKFCLGQRLFGIRVNSDILNSDFLYYYLISKKGQHEIFSRATGTTVAGLRQTALLKILIMFPPVLRQKIIILKIKKEFSLINNTESIINTMLKQLDTLRSSILKQAFEGKLVPQDPNDEPAEKLLQRIKKQKSQQTKTKSRGKK